MNRTKYPEAIEKAEDLLYHYFVNATPSDPLVLSSDGKYEIRSIVRLIFDAAVDVATAEVGKAIQEEMASVAAFMPGKLK